MDQFLNYFSSTCLLFNLKSADLEIWDLKFIILVGYTYDQPPFEFSFMCFISDVIYLIFIEA